MLAYIVRRLLSTLLVMAIVAVFVFLLLHLSPGDPAAIIAGDNATRIRSMPSASKLGLDDPLAVQFVRWVGCGAAGRSRHVDLLRASRCSKLIGQRLEPTLSLALDHAARSPCPGAVAGVLAAAAGSAPGSTARVMVLSVLGFSVPVFVVGYLLIYVFSITAALAAGAGLCADRRGLLGLDPPSDPAVDHARPRLRRADRAHHAREHARRAVARTTSAPPAPRAWRPAPMLLKHALKNAGVPIVTVIGIGVALLIGGVVITETVFNIPGVGRLVVDAISQRDYPIIQGVILVFSGVYVIVNLMVDLTLHAARSEDPLLMADAAATRADARARRLATARAPGVSCGAIRRWSSASSSSASC